MRDFYRPGRSAVFATGGMAATSHPMGTQTALAVLAAGGNAVDAAIAGALVMGIAEPHMCGIGGDAFALLKPAGEDRLVGLNASGRAPAGLSAEALRAKGLQQMPPKDARAVTVPGAIDGFARLSADWGRAGWDALLAPAIRHARAGIPIAPRVASDWAEGAGFSGPGAAILEAMGTPRPGTRFALPQQAEALSRIAAEGRDGFYTGPVAEDIVETLRGLGGTHTLDDFAATSSDYVAPVMGRVRGAELWELPPNGQGVAAILLAQILASFEAPEEPLGLHRLHLETEATKLAYDARNRFVGDPSRVDLRTGHMLAPETARRLAALIDPERAMADPAAISEEVHRDTIYITVVDGDGMAVSLIYSLFHNFGSGIVTERFTIPLQNRGAGFNLKPGHPNEARGGHRPMHTLIPGFLRETDGTWMPFGVMGGPYQATGHARFVSNIVDYGMDPQTAIDAPRAFWDAAGLAVEPGYGDWVAPALEALGHRVVRPLGPIGGAQAIRIRADGVLEGASDPRKDGCAMGL
ncbi:MAG: gamma-glutamyltransferase family protein [Pseudomonadota bacterium]